MMQVWVRLQMQDMYKRGGSVAAHVGMIFQKCLSVDSCDFHYLAPGDDPC